MNAMKACIVPFLIVALLGAQAQAAECDASRGKRAFENKCAMCHQAEKGAGHSVGPNLHGVAGRPVASAEGFAYSEALKAAGGAWTAAQLDKFLAAPQQAVPGTAMPFLGLKVEAERRAVICHLETLN